MSVTLAMLATVDLCPSSSHARAVNKQCFPTQTIREINQYDTLLTCHIIFSVIRYIILTDNLNKTFMETLRRSRTA